MRVCSCRVVFNNDNDGEKNYRGIEDLRLGSSYLGGPFGKGTSKGKGVRLGGKV